MSPSRELADSPASTVAIAYAANKTGDRELERAAKQTLSEQFGILIRFPRAKKAKRAGADRSPVAAT